MNSATRRRHRGVSTTGEVNVTDDRKKVTLGGKDYDIKPIDLGTMREIGLGSGVKKYIKSGKSSTRNRWLGS